MNSSIPIAAPAAPAAAGLDPVALLALAERAGLLMVVSEGLQLVYTSPAIAGCLGYHPDELHGRDFTELLAPENSARVARRARARQHGGDEPQVYEVAAHHRDGSARWFEVEVMPGAIGRRSVTISILHDITHRKDAEQELERAHRELEMFAARVAHDMRSPLHSVQGLAQLLRDHAEEALDGKARRYLERIGEVSEQAQRLVDRLLDLSLLTRAELQRVEVDLAILARTLLDSLRAHHAATGVTALVEPGLRARGDPALLRALMNNLLDNAIKFGGRHLEIGSTLAGGEPAIFVRDDGPGFDARSAHDPFAPFVRLESSRGVPGHGLGLATARRIVERHGGRIRVDSAPGQGTTFTFTLG